MCVSPSHKCTESKNLRLFYDNYFNYLKRFRHAMKLCVRFYKIFQLKVFLQDHCIAVAFCYVVTR